MFGESVGGVHERPPAWAEDSDGPHSEKGAVLFTKPYTNKQKLKTP